MIGEGDASSGKKITGEEPRNEDDDEFPAIDVGAPSDGEGGNVQAGATVMPIYPYLCFVDPTREAGHIACWPSGWTAWYQEEVRY